MMTTTKRLLLPVRFGLTQYPNGQSLETIENGWPRTLATRKDENSAWVPAKGFQTILNTISSMVGEIGK